MRSMETSASWQETEAIKVTSSNASLAVVCIKLNFLNGRTDEPELVSERRVVDEDAVPHMDTRPARTAQATGMEPVTHEGIELFPVHYMDPRRARTAQPTGMPPVTLQQTQMPLPTGMPPVTLQQTQMPLPTGMPPVMLQQTQMPLDQSSWITALELHLRSTRLSHALPVETDWRLKKLELFGLYCRARADVALTWNSETKPLGIALLKDTLQYARNEVKLATDWTRYLTPRTNVTTLVGCAVCVPGCAEANCETKAPSSKAFPCSNIAHFSDAEAIACWENMVAAIQVELLLGPQWIKNVGTNAEKFLAHALRQYSGTTPLKWSEDDVLWHGLCLWHHRGLADATDKNLIRMAVQRYTALQRKIDFILRNWRGLRLEYLDQYSVKSPTRIKVPWSCNIRLRSECATLLNGIWASSTLPEQIQHITTAPPGATKIVFPMCPMTTAPRGATKIVIPMCPMATAPPDTRIGSVNPMEKLRRHLSHSRRPILEPGLVNKQDKDGMEKLQLFRLYCRLRVDMALMWNSTTYELGKELVHVTLNYAETLNLNLGIDWKQPTDTSTWHLMGELRSRLGLNEEVNPQPAPRWLKRGPVNITWGMDESHWLEIWRQASESIDNFNPIRLAVLHYDWMLRTMSNAATCWNRHLTTTQFEGYCRQQPATVCTMPQIERLDGETVERLGIGYPHAGLVGKLDKVLGREPCAELDNLRFSQLMEDRRLPEGSRFHTAIALYLMCKIDEPYIWINDAGCRGIGDVNEYKERLLALQKEILRRTPETIRCRPKNLETMTLSQASAQAESVCRKVQEIMHAEGPKGPIYFVEQPNYENELRKLRWHLAHAAKGLLTDACRWCALKQGREWRSEPPSFYS